jgi:hypothetical protein
MIHDADLLQANATVIAGILNEYILVVSIFNSREIYFYAISLVYLQRFL